MKRLTHIQQREDSDCETCVVAMLMDLPYESVPIFAHHTDRARPAERKGASDRRDKATFDFYASHGLQVAVVMIPATKIPFRDEIAHMCALNKGIPFAALVSAGEASTEANPCIHVVAVCDGIVYDPAEIGPSVARQICEEEYQPIDAVMRGRKRKVWCFEFLVPLQCNRNAIAYATA